MVDYLPSPLDRPAVSAESDEGEVVLPPDPDGPLAGLLFKITHQQHGALSFVRLYSGTLKVGDAVASSQHPQGRRVSRLVRVQADQTHDIEQAVAGDIVAVLGWKDAVSGETLSGRALPLRLENIQAQAPVLAWRLEPARAADLIRWRRDWRAWPRRIRRSALKPIAIRRRPWSGVWASCTWK